ncbi:F-box protein [Rosa sericea]
MDDQSQRGIISTAEGESKDWINELPDCILSSILSLLTIKDAAETSTVSRQWRNLWKTRPPNLELDIVNIFGSVYAPLLERYRSIYSVASLSLQFERQCYIKRVNEVLELYSGNKLDSFKVAFFLNREFTEDLDKWVRFAITKGAQKLDLRLLRGALDPYHNFYVFPHWILADLNASTLKHLSLYRCVLKPPTDFDRFIQLETLSLNDVVVDPDFLARLFSACVLLESFTLNTCDVRSNLIIGPSLHLHDLKVLTCYRLGRIEIDAVNLSSLEYDGSHTEISFMRTPRLVRCFFKGWCIGPVPHVLTQLPLCSELGTLHLQTRDNFEHIPQIFPTLRNLKQVKLDLLMLDFELGSVLNILKAAPLLEELIITTQAPDYHGEMRNLSTFSHNHLRKIKMQGFQGLWFEIEFVISILKIATKLEVMVIDPHGSLYDGDGTWVKLTCCYQDGNEDENPEEYEDPGEDENVDNVPYELFRWQKRGRAAVQERLKDVKSDAQIIIL